MMNVDKLDTQEIRETVSAEDVMSTMQCGFLEIFYELDFLLVKATENPKFYDEARKLIRQTIKDIKSDNKKELSPDLTVIG